MERDSNLLRAASLWPSGSGDDVLVRHSLQRQLDLIERCEPAAYHDDGQDGYFAVLRDDGTRKRQQCYPIRSMHFVLGQQDLRRDTWISQAEFYCPSRKLIHLKRMSVCFADLDTYKVQALAIMTPERQLRDLLSFCNGENLPEPSLVVYSGRGLQVKWLLSAPVPAAGLPRWQCVQRELTKRLSHFGSDPASIDASRVLRLVNSVNSKSGQVVRILHNTGVRYGFDELSSRMLPFLRDELYREARRRELEQNCACAVPMHRPPTKSDRFGQPASNDANKGFTGAQLAWDRLTDLRKLCSIRGWKSGAPDNWRDRAVFLGACFLAQAVPNLARLDREVWALARELAPSWQSERVRDATVTVLRRAQDSLNGVVYEYRGRDCNPRYRFSNRKLIELLEITSGEQLSMKTIVSQEEAQRRDTKHASDKRRAKGMLERGEYEEAAARRHAKAERLRLEGKTWKEVADAVGYKNAKAAQVAVRSAKCRRE